MPQDLWDARGATRQQGQWRGVEQFLCPLHLCCLPCPANTLQGTRAAHRRTAPGPQGRSVAGGRALGTPA